MPRQQEQDSEFPTLSSAAAGTCRTRTQTVRRQPRSGRRDTRDMLTDATAEIQRLRIELAKRDQEQEGKASQEKQLLDIMMAKFKKDFPDAVTEQSKEV